jgi:hypothetical protein
MRGGFDGWYRRGRMQLLGRGLGCSRSGGESCGGVPSVWRHMTRCRCVESLGCVWWRTYWRGWSGCHAWLHFAIVGRGAEV